MPYGLCLVAYASWPICYGLWRIKVSTEFREGNNNIMFTSDVSARGMDYPEVSLVVQVGPGSIFRLYLGYSGHIRHSYPIKKLISHGCTIALLHCCMVARLHWFGTVALWHCCMIALLHG